jgi:hypothetical protein
LGTGLYDASSNGVVEPVATGCQVQSNGCVTSTHPNELNTDAVHSVPDGLKPPEEQDGEQDKDIANNKKKKKKSKGFLNAAVPTNYQHDLPNICIKTGEICKVYKCGFVVCDV